MVERLDGVLIGWNSGAVADNRNEVVGKVYVLLGEIASVVKLSFFGNAYVVRVGPGSVLPCAI